MVMMMIDGEEEKEEEAEEEDQLNKRQRSACTNIARCLEGPPGGSSRSRPTLAPMEEEWRLWQGSGAETCLSRALATRLS